MLVIRNVENLRWALYQSLDQSLQQFSTQLDDRLAATVHATRKGITSVLEKRKESECSTSQETKRFEVFQNRIVQMLTALDAD